MLIGLGREAVTPDSLRRAYALGTRRARAMHLRSLQIPAFTLQRFGGVDRLLEEAVYACKLADYEVSGLKHRKPGDPEPISFLSVNFTGEYVPEKEQAAARRGEDAADTVILARNLINTPANMMYPEAFAEEARGSTLISPWGRAGRILPAWSCLNTPRKAMKTMPLSSSWERASRLTRAVFP